MKALNVTPKEFSEIKEKELELCALDFAYYLNRMFGCDLFKTYRVVVRRDIPYIPYYVIPTERIEEE